LRKPTVSTLEYLCNWISLQHLHCKEGNKLAQFEAIGRNDGQNTRGWGLALKWLFYMGYMGENESAPGVTRTPDLLIRSQTLYPTELRARKEKNRP
jgi:hypothetical protein